MCPKLKYSEIATLLKTCVGYTLSLSDKRLLQLMSQTTRGIYDTRPSLQVICAYILTGTDTDTAHIVFDSEGEMLGFVRKFDRLFRSANRSVGMYSTDLFVNLHTPESILGILSEVKKSDKIIVYNADTLVKNPWVFTPTSDSEINWLRILSDRLNSVDSKVIRQMLNRGDIRITKELNVRLEPVALTYLSRVLRLDIATTPILEVVVSTYIQAYYVYREYIDYEIVNKSVLHLTHIPGLRNPVGIPTVLLNTFLKLKHGNCTELQLTGVVLPITSIIQACEAIIVFTIDMKYCDVLRLPIVNTNLGSTSKIYYVCGYDSKLQYVATKLNQLKDLNTGVAVLCEDTDIPRLSSAINNTVVVGDNVELDDRHCVFIVPVRYYWKLNLTNYKIYTVNLVEIQPRCNVNLNIIDVSKTCGVVPGAVVSQSELQLIHTRFMIKYTSYHNRLTHKLSIAIKLIESAVTRNYEMDTQLLDLETELLATVYNEYVKYKSLKDYEQSMYLLAHQIYTKYENIASHQD